MNRIGLAVAVAAVMSAAGPAWADVNLNTQLSSRRVEVNEPFQLDLQVTTDGSINAGDPHLIVPDGIRAQGPDMNMLGGGFGSIGAVPRRVGVSATWVLVAIRPGKFRIGPPSILINGERKQAKSVTVEVVPEGKGDRRPRGIPGARSMDPFDPFRNPFDAFQRMFPDFRMEPPPEPQVPEYPPEYKIDRQLDPIAFVTAKVSPREVVLGQAVHFSLYAYGARGPFDLGPTSEPSHEDFIAYTVNQDDRPEVYAVPFEDRVLRAVKVTELVLFPIRTGRVRIGPARTGFQGRGYAQRTQPAGLPRESQPIEVNVVEPPLEGRPVGYRLGDVGSYTLSASISKKSLKQGEALAVVARLSGEGHLPPKLNLPQQNGVEWMEPAIAEKIEAANSTVKGERTFTYVVRVDRAGRVELGELALPYYDPEERRYQVARAALGAIDVEANPNAAPPSSDLQPNDRLRGLLAPRKRLGAVAPAAVPLPDRNWFWALLISAPLGVLGVGGALRAGRRWLERARTERATPLRRARQELEAAREAAAQSDLIATAAAVERALHLALESRTGVRARGVLRSELPRSLAARGMPAELAERVVALLETTELSRFVQSEETAARELYARGESVVGDVLKGKRG